MIPNYLSLFFISFWLPMNFFFSLPNFLKSSSNTASDVDSLAEVSPCNAHSLNIKPVYRPDEDLGDLFHNVQMAHIFPDSKTFADCIPLAEPAFIIEQYNKLKTENGFSLAAFVAQYFKLPHTFDAGLASAKSTNERPDMLTHLNKIWDLLTRPADTSARYSSLLALPYPYVVPGGRFREIYYWDSYFTILGLVKSGKNELALQMVDNFAYLICAYGHVPNGNRSYYLSRSQPPFFAAMITELLPLARQDRQAQWLSALETEYKFWMAGTPDLSVRQPAYRRVVRMGDGSVLNRYYDDTPLPRPESYSEDVALAAKFPANLRPEIWRDIRAACESGWDFSSRWFHDGKHLSTIATTAIVPVDLNCLLYQYELLLARLHADKKQSKTAQKYRKAANDRKNAIQKYCWNSSQGFYFDYYFKEKQQSKMLSLAGIFPLWVNIASAAQGREVSAKIRLRFLKAGGLVATPYLSSQQWDAPNGWAPLHWVAIESLSFYGQQHLARQIGSRWLYLNQKTYKSTGKMMEKYNVIDLHLKAGGGEYEAQDGFGWTNGVALVIEDFLKRK